MKKDRFFEQQIRFIIPNDTKIGLITTSYPLRSNPSSGVFVKRLVDALRESISVSVLTPSGESEEFLHDLDFESFRYAPLSYQCLAHQAGGIPYALKKHKLNYLLIPPFLLSLLLSSVCLARKVDILHANWSVTGFIAGVAGLLTRTPVITTLRGDDVKLASNTLVFKVVLRACFRLSARIVAVNHNIVDSLISTYNISKESIHCIPNGVQQSFYQKRRKEIAGTVKIISVGSLIQRKGVDVLIHALGQLKDCQWSLTIVGDGPERPSIDRLIQEYSLENKVIITGLIHPDEVAPLMRKADVFVLSSYSEGRPNVVLEAMASGLAIVSSDIDGISELITDNKNGLIYQKGNYHEMSRLLKTLMEDHDMLTKLGEMAHSYACDEIGTWRDTADHYIDLYRSMLIEPTPSS